MGCKTECMLGFFGSPVKAGYRTGYFQRKYTSLHRIAWEDANQASILPGFVVMHLCDVPACVNPKHLRLGTHLENVRDSIVKGRANNAGARNKAKTHCNAGHPLEGEYIVNRTDGWRECKVCKRTRSAERYKRLKASKHVTT